MAESSEQNPNAPSSSKEALLWIEYAVEQAKSAQKKAEIALDSAISITGSRLSQIRSTSSAHLSITLDSLQDLKSNYNAYEDIAVGKIKEGISIAALYPFVTSGVIVGSGFLMLKGPRRALYYRAMRLFSNEEALYAKAHAKFDGLQKSIQQLEKESEDVKKIASLAEEQMKRGKTKLRQAGNQIRGVIRAADKVEREAAGLKLVLKELPSGTSSILRSEVSNLTSEAKRERHTLNKVVTKISNYGISI